MTRAYLSLVAVLGVAFGVASWAHAQSKDGRDRRVLVINDRTSDMVRLYGSRTTTGDWEENIFTVPLKSGARRVINFDDGTGACSFDFRAIFRDDLTVHAWSFNVCREEYWQVVD